MYRYNNFCVITVLFANGALFQNYTVPVGLRVIFARKILIKKAYVTDYRESLEKE